MLALSQIPLGTTSFAIAKVVGIKDISKTKTDSYFQSIQAVDDTGEILITVFRKDPMDFTCIKLHDIILFQGKFSQSPFGNKLQVSVLADAMVQVVDNVNMLENTLPEINDLKERYDSIVKIGNMAKVSRKREFKALKDVERNMFFDLYGLMISKCYGNMNKSCIMIDMVDFTINKELKRNTRSDVEGLPIDEPCILTVTLWDENVNLVSDIPLNSFISLRNVRSKISAGGVLEGAIHTDRGAFTKSVQVLPSNHDAVVEIKKRSQKGLNTKSPTRLLNSGEGFRLYSVSELLNADSHLKAKIRIRVLDHMPKQLEYFSRPVCIKCEAIFDPTNHPMTCSCGVELVYQFLFSLLVTDETGSIPLIVSDQEAIDLLSNLLPTNLFKDCKTLEILKNLISRIDETWFECFVESYKPLGCELWRFKIFNTVIQRI